MKAKSTATLILSSSHRCDSESIQKRERSHNWFFKNRGPLGALIFVPMGVAIIVSQPLVTHDSAVDHLMEVGGCLSLLAYLFLRIWATLYVGGRKEKELVTQGPYSICRNPLYLGSLCWVFSIVLFLHSLFLLSGLCVVIVIYTRRVIPSEEAMLHSLFGRDFFSYQQTTPMIMPNFGGYRSGENVLVNLSGLRLETKRLLFFSLLALVAFLLCHLRSEPWWPRLFVLP